MTEPAGSSEKGTGLWPSPCFEASFFRLNGYRVDRRLDARNGRKNCLQLWNHSLAAKRWEMSRPDNWRAQSHA